MATLLINCLCVGIGGFLGSVLRYLLGFLAPVDQTGFPFVTFFINVVGAFVITFAMAYFTRDLHVDHQLLLFLRVGLCGGFTTFSAFTMESLQLIQNGEVFLATFYMVASCIICLLMALCGQIAGSHLSA